MRLALLSVVTVGIVIGLWLPVDKAAPVATAATPVAAATARARDRPVETVLERSPAGHFYAIADVNDEPIRFLVDTGATTVALTMDDARRANIPFDPAKFDEVGRGAGGMVRGQRVTLPDVALDGKRATGVRAVVLEGAEISLLGQNFLSHVGTVEIKGDTMRLR